MTWGATHRIILEPAGDGDVKQWLVMLCKDPYSQGGLIGVTEDDWRRQRAPTWCWRKDDGSWWLMGRPVRHARLESMAGGAEPEAKPSTLRYHRRRDASGAHPAHPDSESPSDRPASARDSR
jgi:hypothetical protein